MIKPVNQYGTNLRNYQFCTIGFMMKFKKGNNYDDSIRYHSSKHINVNFSISLCH